MLTLPRTLTMICCSDETYVLMLPPHTFVIGPAENVYVILPPPRPLSDLQVYQV